MTRRAVCIAVALLGVAIASGRPLVARQQVREGAAARPAPAPVGTAVISGTLMSDDSSPRPIRRATVTLTGDVGSGWIAITDDEGRFRLANLPAGRFTLTSIRSGFVRAYYGARRPGLGPGTPIVVTEGQRVDVAMTMPRGAVITGTVVDAFGKPSADVGVQALAYSMKGGGPGVDFARRLWRD